MANWCNNFATFSGEKQNIEKLYDAIEEAQRKQKETWEGQKIHSSDVKEGYFFDIFFDGECVSYDTKWSPNIDDLAEVCKEFGVCAKVDYSESGCQIYGSAEIEADGSYTETNIDNRFLDLIEWDDDNSVYIYQGESYESEFDIIEKYYSKWQETNY
jgi:hypothetical protein